MANSAKKGIDRTVEFLEDVVNNAPTVIAIPVMVCLYVVGAVLILVVG